MDQKEDILNESRNPTECYDTVTFKIDEAVDLFMKKESFLRMIPLEEINELKHKLGNILKKEFEDIMVTLILRDTTLHNHDKKKKKGPKNTQKKCFGGF